jgi:acyl CoA:acetate/3-ketoacid CoA transferase alpha subunit
MPQSRLLSEATLDGITLAIGGFINTNIPMRLACEVLRRRPRNLRLVLGPSAGCIADLFVASGAVREVVSTYVGAEQLRGVAPVFQAEMEAGRLSAWEGDEVHWYAALRAEGEQVGFGVTPIGVGSDLPRVNAEIKELHDPFSGQAVLAVKAIPIDICLLATEAVSPGTGSGLFASQPFGDLHLFHAARQVVVQGEREEIESDRVQRPNDFRIHHADEVIVSPLGCLPFGHSGHYSPDVKSLRRIVDAGEQWRAGDRDPMLAVIAELLDMSDSIAHTSPVSSDTQDGPNE